MTDVYVDASTLIALGTHGHLDLLGVFDGRPVVLEPIQAEVTTEPARTNAARLCDRSDVYRRPTSEIDLDETALEVLGEQAPNGDVYLVGEVLRLTDVEGRAIGVVSDDRRVREVARGLGATVTGTVGVIVRNVEAGRLTVPEAKELVRTVDGQGLHMTGELREKADDLIEDAAN